MTVHQTISPKHFEPLGKALGDLFDFHELGIIVHKCAGEPEMNGISAENIPRWDIARKTLTWAEQQGYTKSFLSHTIAARPNSAELREIVAEAFPLALEATPETRIQVETVVSALRNAHSELADPQVKNCIATSKEKLEQVVQSLRLLETYKNLHDSLHNIQLTPFSYLRMAVRGMAKSFADVQTLRMYHDHVRTAHTIAHSWAERIPAGNLGKESEEHWINNMGAAAEKYQEAIDAEDVRTASLALNVIRRILETEPIRLNNLINVASKNLPLEGLMVTLGDIMVALGHDPNAPETAADDQTTAAPQHSLHAFKQAHESLGDLHALLRAGVVEHDMWQEADNILWSIERAFELPAYDAIIEFTILWPAARAKIAILANNSPDASWSQKIKRYADNLDDGLLHVEGQLEDADSGGDDGNDISSKDGLRQGFDAYRREARYKFFSVDHQLKEDCAALVQISEPLETILQGLDNAE